jgi:hypothetical protein
MHSLRQQENKEALMTLLGWIVVATIGVMGLIVIDHYF